VGQSTERKSTQLIQLNTFTHVIIIIIIIIVNITVVINYPSSFVAATVWPRPTTVNVIVSMARTDKSGMARYS